MPASLKQLISATTLTLSVLALPSYAANSNWDYHGKYGPEHWSGLSAAYQQCNGKNQSPIDIRNTVPTVLPALHINYQSGSENLINNGHTLQVNFKPGSFITVDQQRFNLLQYHIHLPSENLIRGQRFPLEVHMVHANDNNELAVLGLLFKAGKEHAGLKAAFNRLPTQTNESLSLAGLSAQDLIPSNTAHYRFNGSLTTPPCTEGVRWLVFKETIEASPEQLGALKALMPHGNARPVQPANARLIAE